MKRLLIIGGLALAVLLVGGGLILVKSRENPSLTSPLGVATPTPIDEVGFLTWEDPAGFEFSYPAQVKIDPHPEDKINYANLDLTNPAVAGGIKVLVADNSYKSLEDWAKKQQAAGGQVLDSNLGEKLAKKVIFTAPSKIVIAAIDVEALVLLEGDLGEGNYWTRVYNDLVSSFKFVPLASEPTKTGSSGPPAGGAGVIEEEEEIIE